MYASRGWSGMADTVIDPVCGMEIHPEEAAGTVEHDGRTIYFCSPGCRATFLEDPQRYAATMPRENKPDL